MQINDIFIAILNKPSVPRYYRELQKYYSTHGLADEASVIAFLVENKFEKKNEDTAQRADTDQGQ